MVETKHCKKCDTTKSLNDFHRDKKSADGRCFYCKECNKAKARQNYRDNPDRVRAYEKQNRDHRERNYRSKYGIGVADYDEMLERQGGVCAACKKPERRTQTENLAVDHCHSTGVVRGLLCSNCNRALGLLNDDPEIIAGLLEYLSSASQSKRSEQE